MPLRVVLKILFLFISSAVFFEMSEADIENERYKRSLSKESLINVEIYYRIISSGVDFVNTNILSDM